MLRQKVYVDYRDDHLPNLCYENGLILEVEGIKKTN